MRSINEVKRLRRKYGLTQQELAERAGVSQSLIAKIEAGLLDPTFTRAKKIFDALADVEEKAELKAKDVMHKNVMFVSMSDSVKESIVIMKKKGISQIPVMHKENVVGIVTEKGILREIVDNSSGIERLKVGDVMEDVPPIVSVKMGMGMLMQLLKDYQILLVAEKGEIKGIISKADLLGRI